MKTKDTKRKRKKKERKTVLVKIQYDAHIYTSNVSHKKLRI